MNTKNERNRVGEGEIDTNEDRELPKTIPKAITLTNIGSMPIVIGYQCNGSFPSLYHSGEPLPFDRSCGCPCDGQV